MPEVVFSVDQSKSMADQAVPGHNRWHPDIPPAASVRPGSEFRVECREWTDAQLGNNDSANDVRDVNLNVAHMLSGPIEIQGAEPVPYFSAPDPPEVKGRYKIMSPMPPPPEDNRVVVEICDYQPAKEYVDAATSIKKTWGSMAPQIKIGFTDRLKEQAHLQMGGQAPKFDVSDQPALIELGGDPVDKRATRAELLGYLRQPGINI